MPHFVDIKNACDILKISRSKLLRIVSSGDFPPPAKVNGKSVWMVDEIDLMTKCLISGMSTVGVKKTIQEILNRREFYRDIYDEV